MTTAPVSRRGSFWGSLQFVLSGYRRHVVLSVLAPLFVVAMMCALPRFSFVQAIAMIGTFLVPWTLVLEIALADRLAFLALLPQPATPRRLVLLPLCLFALVVSVALATVSRAPVLGAVAVFGCLCWMIGTTRSLLRLRFWPLALPLPLFAPLVSVAVHHVAGWGLAAAAAMALGIAALSFQSRALLGMGSEGTPARQTEPPGVRREAVSPAVPEREAWLASTGRFLRVVNAHLRGVHLFTFIVAAGAIAVLHFPGCALIFLTICGESQLIGAAFSPEATEFFGPRPVSAGQRWVGGLLVPLLITVGLAVLLMLPCLSLDWINGGGLPGRLFRHPPFFAKPSMEFLRGLGATFLPKEWPAGGLSAADWARVRPLLWVDILRAILFVIAGLFATATQPIATGNRRQQAPIGMLIFMMIMFSAARIWAGDVSLLARIPIPTWWFAGLLAIAAFAYWRHRVRRAHSLVLTGGDVAPAVGIRGFQ